MPALNEQGLFPESLDAPADEAVAVTPSDTVDLTYATRALYIGVSGDLSVDMLTTGTAIVLKNVPIGILPIRVTRVLASNTTATNIVALW